MTFKEKPCLFVEKVVNTNKSAEQFFIPRLGLLVPSFGIKNCSALFYNLKSVRIKMPSHFPHYP